MGPHSKGLDYPELITPLVSARTAQQFVAIKINDDRIHEVIYSELGGFEGAEAFLELMISISGLKWNRE